MFENKIKGLMLVGTSAIAIGVLSLSLASCKKNKNVKVDEETWYQRANSIVQTRDSDTSSYVAPTKMTCSIESITGSVRETSHYYNDNSEFVIDLDNFYYHYKASSIESLTGDNLDFSDQYYDNSNYYHESYFYLDESASCFYLVASEKIIDGSGEYMKEKEKVTLSKKFSLSSNDIATLKNNPTSFYDIMRTDYNTFINLSEVNEKFEHPSYIYDIINIEKISFVQSPTSYYETYIKNAKDNTTSLSFDSTWFSGDYNIDSVEYTSSNESSVGLDFKAKRDAIIEEDEVKVISDAEYNISYENYNCTYVNYSYKGYVYELNEQTKNYDVLDKTQEMKQSYTISYVANCSKPEVTNLIND